MPPNITKKSYNRNVDLTSVSSGPANRAARGGRGVEHACSLRRGYWLLACSVRVEPVHSCHLSRILPSNAGNPLRETIEDATQVEFPFLEPLDGVDRPCRAGPGRIAGLRDRAIFPANSKHNHSSCVVETKDGSLLATWYAGSGERSADDVVIEGAWLKKGSTKWEPKFQMADTPGYPDCNPALFAAPNGSVWLFWPTILDHRWEGALLKYAHADNPRTGVAPIEWSRTGVLHITPRDFAGNAEGNCGFTYNRQGEVSDDAGPVRGAVAGRALPATRLDAASSSDCTSQRPMDPAALYGHV